MNTYSTVIEIYCGRNIVSEVMYHVFRQIQRTAIEKNAVFMKKTITADLPENPFADGGGKDEKKMKDGFFRCGKAGKKWHPEQDLNLRPTV